MHLAVTYGELRDVETMKKEELKNRIQTNTLKFNDGIELLKAGFNPFNEKN